MSFDRVTDTWDHEVYIVGGGPSLRDFDFSSLDGRFKLGCNKGAWLANCDAMFTLDQHFARMHYNDIVEFSENGGDAYIALPSNFQKHTKIPGVHYMMHERGSGLAHNLDRINGVNSGFGALNLAYHKRAPKVYLLGFDFKAGKDGTHWHGGYSWFNKNTHKWYDKWASNFERAKQQLDESGVEVINVVGPEGSAVKAFETMPLESL